MGAAERLAQIAAEIRAHGDCGFEPCTTCTNPVPGEGNPEAEVVFVGEAPGRQEDLAGRPFVGLAGRLLDELLDSIALSRDDVFVTNVLKARPPANRDPRRDEILHSWRWLSAQLEAIEPRVVVPLGRHALRCFAPGEAIGRVHGRALERDGRTLFPMYHPAAGCRSTRLRQTMFDDIARLPGVLAAARAP